MVSKTGLSLVDKIAVLKEMKLLLKLNSLLSKFRSNKKRESAIFAGFS